MAAFNDRGGRARQRAGRLAIALAAAVPAASASQGFELEGDLITVDRPSHWRDWRYQNDLVSSRSGAVDSVGLFEIRADGLQPRYFPGLENYVLSRRAYTYEDQVGGRGLASGRITSPSNEVLAPRVGDGDPATFWEPAPEHYEASELRKWAVEVDLGRTVWADSVVVVFVDDGVGDVLQRFVVEVSTGSRSSGVGGNLVFQVVAQIAATDTPGRRYVIPLQQEGADFDLDGLPDFEGRFLQHVRVRALTSDFGRKQFLGSGESGRISYESLPPERRGERLYQRRAAGGLLTRVDSAAYFDRLAPGDRGPVQYFTRDLPRLAEVEVWGAGPNVAYRVQDRTGGGIEDGRAEIPAVTDGVYATSWDANSWDQRFSSNFAGHVQSVCCTAWLDLGAVFWVDAIHVGTSDAQGFRVKGYDLQGSDGTVLQPVSIEDTGDFGQLETGLAWTDLISDLHRDNRTARSIVASERFGLRKLRFLQFRNVNPAGRARGVYSEYGNISEIQAYGRGWPARVNVTSPPMVLLPGVDAADAASVRQRRGVARISWEAEAVVRTADGAGEALVVTEPLELHPEVQLLLQTRTSDRIDSSFTYYEVSGVGTRNEKIEEVDQADYLSLQESWDLFNRWDALPETRTLVLRPHATGRDDDGDGRTDEDGIDGLDNDGDGLIDEDALTGDTGGPNDRGSITLQRHSRRRDDDGDGVEDEDPIDGVDNDRDGLIDEDGRKIAKPRQEPLLTITPVFAGWSPWSPPYRSSAGRRQALVSSPSPRKFLQVRATMLSDDPDATVRLKSVQVELAPPISTGAVGELAIVTPAGARRAVDDLDAAPGDYAAPRDISPVAEQRYAYFIRAAGPDPLAPDARRGFDQVLLKVPFPARVAGVRLGRVRVEAAAGAGVERASGSRFLDGFAPAGDGARLTGPAGDLDVWTSAAEDSVVVSFPGPVNRGLEAGEQALVEIQFSAVTPRSGTEFEAFLLASGTPLFQRVDIFGQDATELVDSGTATPRIAATGFGLLADVRAGPVVTPNGDGVNDELTVEFTLLHLLAERPVTVELFDLSGRRVAAARPASGTGEARSGRLVFGWDGTDVSGGLVPPGTYVLSIRVRSDRRDEEVLRVVHVAY